MSKALILLQRYIFPSKKLAQFDKNIYLCTAILKNSHPQEAISTEKHTLLKSFGSLGEWLKPPVC
ncbi:MAG: hypothetical protein IJK15_06170 [Bacteroidaceae bacterium]|nr:hypothetical protein [Bacteroidaceae bacterium]MBR0433260.1 hypothetical protein [Bacteroidaceae bacterium]